MVYIHENFNKYLQKLLTMAKTITGSSIKLKIVAVLSLMAIEENDIAVKLLSQTLRDVGKSGIPEIEYDQCIRVVDLFGEAIIFVLDGLHEKSKINLQKIVEELSVNNLIRKRMILRESCGDLAILPYDLREKIVGDI